MNLPKVIDDLLKAQASFDSRAFSGCFTEDATVKDEGQSYNGRKEIERWNAEVNEKYKTVLQPFSYDENGQVAVLTTKVSGTFPGSPLTLKYHFRISQGLIASLTING